MVIFICILIMLVCFTIVVLMNKSESNNEEIRREKVEEIIKENQINISKRFDCKSSYTLINDSESKCFWCIINSDVVKKFNYKDIIQVELKQDDESVISTSRASQLGGALVGGVLAGGIGAVIGGLSGKQKQQKDVKNVELVLTLDDLDDPFFKIEFAYFHKPVETNSYLYLVAYEEAYAWFKLTEVILRRNDAIKDKNYNL